MMAICFGVHLASAETKETNSLVLPDAARPITLLDDRQKLGPGDRVTYRVIEDQDDPRSLTITDSGDLEVPYLGLVHAAGKTSLQLAKEVKGLLEKQLYYQIPAGENFTVSKAILNAGGFSDFSDKKNVRLIRKTANGKQTFVINVVDIWEKGNLDKDLVVQPDDLIVVPARLVNY